MKIGDFVQQGDVLIKKSNGNLSGMKKVVRKEKGFVLAEGEATGHAHITTDNIEMFEKDGVLYIEADEEFTIKHEEHNPITIDKGVYEIGIVQEYDHFAEESRAVQD